jgi:23S rRNA pseudouridine955/2504/2580 synthase
MSYGKKPPRTRPVRGSSDAPRTSVAVEPQATPDASLSETFSKVSYVDAGAGEAGQRIDNFLLRVLRNVPKSHVYRLLRKGEVRVNGKRAKPEVRLNEGDRVRLPPIRLDAAPDVLPPSRNLQSVIEAAVIFEDDDILAAGCRTV